MNKRERKEQSNKWTLEFDAGEVPEEYLAAYQKAKALNAGFLLCLLQVVNLIADVILVIKAFASEDWRYSSLVQDLFRIVVVADLSLGMVYAFCYCVIIRRCGCAPRGFIACLCLLNILVQTEVNTAVPGSDPEYYTFAMSTYAITCLICAAGEDNYLHIVVFCFSSLLYVIVRDTENAVATFPIYLLACGFYLIFNYTAVLNRKQLLLDKTKFATNSRNWENVLHTQPDGIIICANSKVLYSNQAFDGLIAKHKEEETIERKVAAFLSNNHCIVDCTGEQHVIDPGVKGLCGLKDGSYSLVLYRTEGHGEEAVRYALNKSPMLFKETVATLFIIRDYSELETLQRKVSEGKFRSVLLSTITHDIKTPLAVILGNLTLLEGYVKAEGREFFQAVHAATETLQYFMQDIVDLKRIAEGNFSLEFSTVYLGSVLDRLVALTAISAKMKRLRFTINSTVDTPIFTDHERLLQVLLNLTRNAIKYTRCGGVEVVARKLPCAQGEDADSLGKIEIAVKDTGIGIKPEDQENLFKMFGLVDKKSANCETGVGIGMYLAKYIVTQMQGTLDLVSSPEEGTTVTLVIPCCRSLSGPFCSGSMESFVGLDDNGTPRSKKGALGGTKLTPPLRSAEMLETSTKLLKSEEISIVVNGTARLGEQQETEEAKTVVLSSNIKKQVLVVEDDPLVLLAMKSMIKRLGYYVDSAENGELAVDMVREKNGLRITKYDLVLMDINMPIMNGYQAAAKINEMIGTKEIEPVPVVCVSAQDSPEHQTMCKESGIVELVGKPVDYERLRKLLEKYARG